MKYLKLIAAALTMVALSACVGFVVPIPLSHSPEARDADHGRNELRMTEPDHGHNERR